MPLSKEKRLAAFANFGGLLMDYASGNLTRSKFLDVIHEGVEASVAHNPWFTVANIKQALVALAEMLDLAELERWIGKYQLSHDQGKKNLTVGIIMAGNIPAVGFHDLLCALIAGYKAIVKLSSDDPYLIPAMVCVLQKIEPGFSTLVSYEPFSVEPAEAIIATGSDNTARYFEYHYSHRPHIFRKNRNSIAVLDGNETSDQLSKLSDDVFLYFGRGCRNVSKVYVPMGYDFQDMLSVFEKHQGVRHHKPYMNNYTVQKALFKMQKTDFRDNGFLLLTPSHSISSGIAVLNFEPYSDLSSLIDEISLKDDKIQCIVSSMDVKRKTVYFGKTQQPAVDDYADGIDTMRFLVNLKDSLR